MGKMRNILALNSWLYGGDPMLYLTYRELFAQLRQEIGTGYYEALLRETLLDASNMAEPLMTAAQKGASADADYFCGISYADRRQIRHQMLTLTPHDLLRYCVLFETMSEQNAHCVVGSSDALARCGKDWKIQTL